MVRILNNETCRLVLNALKGICCDFALPKRVPSDNGPCFKAEEFVNFHIKLGITVEKKNCAYTHQHVGCVEHMVQTVKQIMTRNTENAWLVMLIFKATDIPGNNKSPSEILNSRKYKTNLPTIDISQKSNESEIDKLVERRFSKSKSGTGKELSKIPVGRPILYEKNPNSSKIKHPNWCKGTIKDWKNLRSYEILTDNDRIVTRSRHHIKAYLTRSGRVNKASQRLIEN